MEAFRLRHHQGVALIAGIIEHDVMGKSVKFFARASNKVTTLSLLMSRHWSR